MAFASANMVEQVSVGLTLVVQVELLATRLGFVLTHLDSDTLGHVKFEYPKSGPRFSRYFAPRLEVLDPCRGPVLPGETPL